MSWAVIRSRGSHWPQSNNSCVTQSLSTMLFEVRPGDLATSFLVALGLSAVALAATWIPARRAATVDPMVALRDE